MRALYLYMVSKLVRGAPMVITWKKTYEKDNFTTIFKICETDFPLPSEAVTSKKIVSFLSGLPDIN